MLRFNYIGNPDLSQQICHVRSITQLRFSLRPRYCILQKEKSSKDLQPNMD